LTAVAFSASGGSSTFSTLLFSNANGLTFSNVLGHVEASYTVPTLTNSSWTVSDAATSGTVARLAFTNLNGVTLSLSSGAAGLHTIVGSHNALTSQSNQNVTAANGGFAFQTLSFSNTHGFTFGTSAGSAIFGSHNGLTIQTNQQMTMFATGNTTQSSTGTTNASSLIFRGEGIASIGITAGSIVVSVPAGGGAGDGGNTLAAGTRTAATSAALLFDNANGVTFGLNAVAGTIMTASIAVPTINISAGTTDSSASAFSFSNDTGIGEIQFGMNGNTLTASVSRRTYSTTVVGLNSGGQSSSTVGQNTMFIFPHILEDYVTCAAIKIPIALTNSSSAAASIQNGWTAQMAIYTRNATNSTVLTQHYSTSYTMAVSHNSNVSWMLSLITAVGNSTSYSTLSASSAGINLSSSLHGIREIIMPVSSLFTPGEYWFAYKNSTSSVGGAGSVLRISNIIVLSNTGNRVGVVLNASNHGLARNLMQGFYSATTASPPAGISETQINMIGVAIPMFMISATV
jgi:hypothetical protein